MPFHSFEEVACEAEELQREILVSGDSPERVWAAWAIGLRHGRDAIPALARPLAVEADPGVRCHLVNVLAGLGERAALFALAASDPDPDVRALACHCAIQTAEQSQQDVVRGFLASRLHQDQATEPVLQILNVYPAAWPRLDLNDLTAPLDHPAADVRMAAVAYVAARYRPDELFPESLGRRLEFTETDPAILRQLGRLAAGVAEGAILSAAARVPASALDLLQDLVRLERRIEWSALSPVARHPDPRVGAAIFALCANKTALPVLEWLASVIVTPYTPMPDAFASSDDEQGRRAASNTLHEAAAAALLHWAAHSSEPAPGSLSPALQLMRDDIEAHLTWLLTESVDYLEEEGIDYTAELESLQQRRLTLVRALGNPGPGAV